jgi:hypothetical protein
MTTSTYYILLYFIQKIKIIIISNHDKKFINGVFSKFEAIKLRKILFELFEGW